MEGTQITKKDSRPPRPHHAARTLRLIVIYKFSKAIVEIILASLLFVFLKSDGPHKLMLAAQFSRRNLASVLSLSAAKWLLRANPLQLFYTNLALVLDGFLCFFEGFSLHEGYSWASWFIVAATGLPLPL